MNFNYRIFRLLQISRLLLPGRFAALCRLVWDYKKTQVVFFALNQRIMLKDNILEDGMSIMSFNIGKLIVINDERTDVSTLRKHRGYYLQAHASVLSNIDTLSADVSRVFSLSFASILFGQNKDSDPTVAGGVTPTPNSTIFATLLTMFSLFDQCAVLLCNKLGEMISPEEAVFFGVKSNQTVIELTNRARPEHIGLLLSAFGFVGETPEKMRSLEPFKQIQHLGIKN